MNSISSPQHGGCGFENQALGSQQTFRAIFSAMERPGHLITICENPSAPDVFYSASAATCLTLLDYETPVWTDIDLKSPAISWLQLVCGSSVVTETCMAYFAIITKPAAMPALDNFRIGPHEHPEKATTIIVQVEDIVPSMEQPHSGIFVDQIPRLELKGISENFWHQWQQISSLYPMAIDIFFTCDDVLTALPKVKRIEP